MASALQLPSLRRRGWPADLQFLTARPSEGPQIINCFFIKVDDIKNAWRLCPCWETQAGIWCGIWSATKTSEDLWVFLPLLPSMQEDIHACACHPLRAGSLGRVGAAVLEWAPFLSEQHQILCQAVVAQTFVPSTQEAEAGRSLIARPTWSQSKF